MLENTSVNKSIIFSYNPLTYMVIMCYNITYLNKGINMIYILTRYFRNTFLIFIITLTITSLMNGSFNTKHISRALETYGVKSLVTSVIRSHNR